MVKIVGKLKLNYKNREGNLVDGYKVYTEMENPDNPNLCGCVCDGVFVSPDVFHNYFDVPLGTYVEIFYNKYGRPVGCTVLERS